MHFFRSMGYVAIIVSTMMAVAGCTGGVRIRRAPGPPSTSLHGLEGARTSNVSLGRANNLGYLRLPSNDVVATIQTSDTSAMIRCYSHDSLRMLWSTSYRTHPSDDGDESRVRIYNHEDAIVLLTSARDGSDLIMTGRMFDRATGALRKDTLLFRTRYARVVMQGHRRIKTDDSPNGEYMVARIVSTYIDEHAYEIDLLLLRSDLTPVLRRQIRFNHGIDETLQDVRVDDEGNVFLISQNDRNMIQVIKLRLLGEERQQTLKVTFNQSTGSQLAHCAAVIEDPYTVRVMAGSVSDWSLTGVAVAAFDFRHDTVISARLVQIESDTIAGALMGSRALQPAFMHGCLVRQSSPAYMMMFEELSTPQYHPDWVQCSNVLMVGLERNGAFKWCSGLLKSQLDKSGSLASASFDAQMIADQTLRITYPLMSRLMIRDFRLVDGVPVDSGPARAVLEIGDGGGVQGSFLRSTITWLDERTMVVGVSVLENGDEDVKLCRVEL